MADWAARGARWGLLAGGLLVVVAGVVTDEYGAVVVGGIALLLGLGLWWKERS